MAGQTRTGLAAAEFTLSNLDGTSPVVFDVNPVTYDPINIIERGSSHQVLDGSVIHQVFGVNKKDDIIRLQGLIYAKTTLLALYNKYKNPSQTYLLTDYYPNQFSVIFAPGATFKPVPVYGSLESHTFDMEFRVIDILQWFGGGF